MHLSLGNLFDFASTIAVLALLAVPYGLALRGIASPAVRNVSLGALFGFAAMGAMLQPVTLEAGVIFDLRALPIGLAGGFLGPLGALPAVAISAATRAMIGGSGMPAGLLSIAIAGAAGVAWFYVAPRLRLNLPLKLVALSAMISLNFLSIAMLPAELAAAALVHIVPFSVLLNLAGTLTVGGILDRERAAVEREDALKAETMQDPLTGVSNRRGFDQLMVERAGNRRSPGSGCALLVLDLDHFKVINDTYGHEVGDSVLAELGIRLKDCLRGSDIVARFGGEEFVVFLPSTSIDSAIAVAERLRRSVSDKAFVAGGASIPVSISVGAHWEPEVFECASAFASADRALYRAKSGGRNRVFFDHWPEGTEFNPPAGRGAVRQIGRTLRDGSPVMAAA